MAEGLARHLAAEQGCEITVSSAGLMRGGAPAAEYAVQVCAERGVDIAGHISRQISSEIVDAADLILTMERMHVREIAVQYRQTLPRLFTLKEFVRRSFVVPRDDQEVFADWVLRISSARQISDLMATGLDDDIADPMGRGIRHFVSTANELSVDVKRVLGLACT